MNNFHFTVYMDHNPSNFQAVVQRRANLIEKDIVFLFQFYVSASQTTLEIIGGQGESFTKVNIRCSNIDEDELKKVYQRLINNPKYCVSPLTIIPNMVECPT